MAPCVSPYRLTLTDEVVGEEPAEQTGWDRHQPGHHIEDPALWGKRTPQQGTGLRRPLAS